MIIRVQFVKMKYHKHEVIYPWAIFAVRESDTISQMFTKIKEGKNIVFILFLPVFIYQILTTRINRIEGQFGERLGNVFRICVKDARSIRINLG